MDQNSSEQEQQLELMNMEAPPVPALISSALSFKKNPSASDQTLLDGVPRPASRQTFLTSGFLPLIDPSEPPVLWHFWPEVPSEAVAINYLKLKKNRRLMEKAQSEGIKHAIGYDGKVASVLIGENRELDLLEVPAYADDLDQMGFDAATTHDDYIYPDDSSSAQWSRIHTMLDKATKLSRLDPDAELIGIVQGASNLQIEFCVDSLLKMGIQRMALPCSDLSARRRPRPITEFSRICQKRGLWYWLVGINSQELMSRFSAADVISGYAWCYRGAKRQIYRDGLMARAVSPGFCRHVTCRELASKGLMLDELCSRHNVLYLMDFLAGRNTAS